MQFNPMFLENNEVANNIMLAQPGKLKNNKYLFKDIIKVLMNKGKVDTSDVKKADIGGEKNTDNIKLTFVKGQYLNLKNKVKDKSDLQNLAAFIPPSIMEKLEALGLGKNDETGTKAFSVDLSWNKLKLMTSNVITKNALKQSLSQNKDLLLSLQKGNAQINIDIKQENTANTSAAKYNVNITLINDANSFIEEINGEGNSGKVKLPFLQIKNDSNTGNKIIDISTKVNNSSKHSVGVINKVTETENESLNGTSIKIEANKVYKNIRQNLSFQISRGKNLKLVKTKSKSKSLENTNPNENTKNAIQSKIKLSLFSYSDANKNANKGEIKQQIVVDSRNGNRKAELVQINKQKQSGENLFNNKELKNIVFKREITSNLLKTSNALRSESINDKNKTATANTSNKVVTEHTVKQKGVVQQSVNKDIAATSMNNESSNLDKIQITNNRVNNTIINKIAVKVTTGVGENNTIKQKSFTQKPVDKNEAKVIIKNESLNISKGKNNTDYLNNKSIKSNDGAKNSKSIEVPAKGIQNNNKISSGKEHHPVEELKNNNIEIKSRAVEKDSKTVKLNNKDAKQKVLHNTELSDASKKDNVKYSGKTIADKLTKPQLRSNAIPDNKINHLKSFNIEENNGLKASETEYKETGSGSDKTLRISHDSETKQDQSNKAKIVDKTKETVTVKGKSINHNSMKSDEKKVVLDSESKAINVGPGDEKKELVRKEVKVDLTKYSNAAEGGKKEYVKTSQSIKPDDQKNEKAILNTVKHADGKQAEVNKNAKPAGLSSVKGEKQSSDDGQNSRSNENLDKHSSEKNIDASLGEKHVSNKHSKFDDVIEGLNNTINHKAESASKEVNLKQTTEHLLKQQDVVKEISKFIQKNDKSSISFDLEPRHLGKLKITLDLHDAVVKAHIQVENSAAKQLIENNLNELLSNLSRSGVPMGSVNISLNDAKERQTKKEQEKHKINSVNSSGGGSEQESAKASKMMGYNTYEYLI